MSSTPPPAPPHARAAVLDLLKGNTPWVLLIAIGVTVLSEISRTVGDVLTPGSITYELNAAVGPLAFLNYDAWHAWRNGEFSVDQLLLGHILMDLVFVLGYSVLVWRLGDGSLWLRRLLAAIVVVEVLEAICLGVAVGLRLDVADAWVVIEVGLASAKWLLALGMVTVAIVHPVVRNRIGRGLKRAIYAVYQQRLVFIFVTAIGLLALVPGSGIFEQLPDAQRAWLSVPGPQAIDGWAIFWAITAVTAMVLSIHTIARQRAAAIHRLSHESLPDRQPAGLWAWMIAPLTVAILGAAVWLLSDDALLDRTPYMTFVIVSAGLVVISVALRLLPWDWPNRDHLKLVEAPLPDDTRRVGDALVTAFIAVACLAPLRAFTSPVLVSGSFYASDITAQTRASLSWMIWLFGAFLLIALVVPCIVNVVMRQRYEGRLRTLEEEGETADHGVERALLGMRPVKRRKVTAYIALGIATLVVLTALCVPNVFAEVGVVAATVLLLGSIVVLIGLLTIGLEQRRPLEVFQLFGGASNPIVTLLIVVPLVVGMSGGAASFHRLQPDPTPVSVDTYPRPSLEQALQRWSERTAGCTNSWAAVHGEPVPGDAEARPEYFNYRPLVLIAAEGGGARAAAWTVKVLNNLALTSCTAAAPLLSSGVSGGSAGLAAMRVELEGDAGSQRGYYFPDELASLTKRTEESVSNPSVLSNAITGLLGRDILAAVTGIRVPSFETVDGRLTPVWRDRAGMIEAVWARQGESFADSWTSIPNPTIGYTILNSSAAVVDCKVIVSQIDFDSEQPKPLEEVKDESVECVGGDAVLPGTIDLVDFYSDCPFQVTWATATMASARFPFVTPAGRIAPAEEDSRDPEPCTHLRDLQLIDGGYTDNTGLGTLETIAPSLMALIRDHNGQQGRVDDFIVPIVMYVSNDYRSDAKPPPSQLESDLSIPLNSRTAAKEAQLLAAQRLDRLSDQLVFACSPGGDPDVLERCDAARAASEDWVPNGIVLVAPTTEPFIQVPLGWTLSGISTSQYVRELRQQLTAWEPDEDEPAQSKCMRLVGDERPTLNDDYGTLGELMCLLAPTAHR